MLGNLGYRYLAEIKNVIPLLPVGMVAEQSTNEAYLSGWLLSSLLMKLSRVPVLIAEWECRMRERSRDHTSVLPSESESIL